MQRLRRPRRRRAGHGERRRRHVPRRPPRGDRAHPRSLDVADLQLGDVGVGAPRPAGRGAGAVLRVRYNRRVHGAPDGLTCEVVEMAAEHGSRRRLYGSPGAVAIVEVTGYVHHEHRPRGRRTAMGMVRRRTRRRTMLVAGGAAYAAGRAGRGDDSGGRGRPRATSRSPRRRRRLPRRPAAESQADEIQRLAELHASGALTDEEFAAAKAKALGI